MSVTLTLDEALTKFVDAHPVTLDLMRQVLELDWLVRQELSRNIQITVRTQNGAASKTPWYSVR